MGIVKDPFTSFGSYTTKTALVKSRRHADQVEISVTGDVMTIESGDSKMEIGAETAKALADAILELTKE